MSLENTRDIGTAKIVMVGAGGGASYNAGTGIDITNNTIHNTECGARSGIIDSISSSRAHTLITLATNETFKAGETIILKSEVSGSASTLRVQYASSESSVRDFNFYETDGTTTKTVSFAVGTVVLVMLDQTGYKALVLSEDVSGGASSLSDLTDTSISTPTNGQVLGYDSTSGKWENQTISEMPENPLATSHGGTGNADGYIRTGAASGSTIGTGATAEGHSTTASGVYAHAEGEEATASGRSAHAEGYCTTASGARSHAEGFYTTASGDRTHAAGYYTTAGYNDQTTVGRYNSNQSTTLFEVGNGSSLADKSNAFEVHANGNATIKSNTYVGGNVVAKDYVGDNVIVTGSITNDEGILHRVEGNPSDTASVDLTKIKIGTAVYSIPNNGLPENPLATSHGGTGNANGYIRTGLQSGETAGSSATAEGVDNKARGNYSHAEGYSNSALGNNSHVEGSMTIAEGLASHAEGGYFQSSLGVGSWAEGDYSHAEGADNHASGDFSHAEGWDNTVSSPAGHVEGAKNTVSGNYAHAEGYDTTASGNYSHAGGYDTTAGYLVQTAIGKFNDNKSTTLFEVGNGTSTNARNNAFEVYSDGKISCDNGASKFQFTQNNGSDGYYDASGVFHAFVSGGGNTVSKTRYQISSSSWSSSANSDGFYTLTTTLNPAIGSSPDVYIAGSANGTQPTSTEEGQFAYVKKCKVNGSTLTLYATSKPSSTFYIWVEGVNGTGSGDIVGNIIKPNEVSGGGGTITHDDIYIVKNDFTLNNDSYIYNTAFSSTIYNKLLSCKRARLTFYSVDFGYSGLVFAFVLPIMIDPSITTIRNNVDFPTYAVQTGIEEAKISISINTTTANPYLKFTKTRLDTLYNNWPNGRILIRVEYEN